MSKTSMFQCYMFPVFVAFLLANTVDVQAAMQEYKKEGYLFIPWGDGKGKLPLWEGVLDNISGGKSLAHRGPRTFTVDEVGNVYFTCMNREERYIVKGFNPKGEELGSYDPQLKLRHYLSDLLIDNGKIIFVNPYKEKEIFILGDNWKLEKRISIPSSDVEMSHGYVIEDGAVFSYRPMNGKKGYHVFNQEAWKKWGMPKTYSNKRNRRLLYNYELSLYSDGPENDPRRYVVVKSLKPLGGQDHPVTICENASRKPFRGYMSFVDQFRNAYLGYYFNSPKTGDWILLKISPRGKLLYKLTVKGDRYVVGGVAPVFVDAEGKIYELRGSPEGMFVDRWVFVDP